MDFVSPWTPAPSRASLGGLPTPDGNPDFGACVVCGQPIGGERHWHHRGTETHARCKDWRGEAFPYEWELDRLRKLSRALRNMTRAVDAAGIWLAAVKRAWPRDAHVRLDQWGARRTRLADELREFVERVGRLK